MTTNQNNRGDAETPSKTLKRVAHAVTVWALGFALLLVSGCFTSEGPFYEEKQIAQDKRLEGSFENSSMDKKDGTSWDIWPDLDNEGKYHIRITDGPATIELLGTLFKLDGRLFMDLFPMSDSGVQHVGGVVTVSEAIHGIMFRPVHAVWKVELSTDGIAYSFPTGNGNMAALREAPELKAMYDTNRQVFLMPSSPKVSQKYLARFAMNTSVFNYKGELKRKSQ
jgi:hypothetical protein